MVMCQQAFAKSVPMTTVIVHPSTEAQKKPTGLKHAGRA
jgi:hypothetical protein